MSHKHKRVFTNITVITPYFPYQTLKLLNSGTSVCSSHDPLSVLQEEVRLNNPEPGEMASYERAVTGISQ